MSYTLELHPSAKKELEKLDPQTKRFIVVSLREFIDNYRHEYENELMKTGKIKRLKGRWEGFYRLRLRTYRVIYEKFENRLVIHIVRIAHRKEVY